MLRLITLVSAIAVVALAGIPSAFADNGRTQLTGYGGVAGNVQKKIDRKDPSSGALAAPATRASLPFTGMDLTVILSGGLLLAGTGLVLRRRARQRIE
jgi:hypothetical protein